MGNVIKISDHKRLISHKLCGDCQKNGITCNEGDDICLPLEMFVQLCKEPKPLKRLEFLENVSDSLDLGNSFDGR